MLSDSTRRRLYTPVVTSRQRCEWDSSPARACVLATVTWWTWNEGVWGDQRDAAECAARWREYIEAIHTRRPPAYDRCGRVIVRIPAHAPSRGGRATAGRTRPPSATRPRRGKRPPMH
ncbi:hypothetical protein EVAR_40965_1 [Eumeta japonica]|uniref:Uncharacterized protein n=1 Tax=Eumeta variegata TaxID=151549 RepID=A0A4C1X813_EUMVA|nr:hypothetical protein EVAR_40965_1 [Eumeta japonica]